MHTLAVRQPEMQTGIVMLTKKTDSALARAFRMMVEPIITVVGPETWRFSKKLTH